MKEEQLIESTITRINVKETLEKSWKLYKDNFKLFISISLVSFIISFSSSVLNRAERIIPMNELSMVYSILLLFLTLVVTFYSIKISVALYLCITMRYKDINTSFRYCYNSASEKIWRYIGIGIKLFLILGIPVIGLMIASIYAKGIVKYLLIVVFLVPSTYLSTVYGFAPIMGILEDEKLSYFKFSKKIVKGDFWRILLLTFLTSILFMIPYIVYMHVFRDFKEISYLERFIVATINQILLIFTRPFSMSTHIMMYSKLKENKGIGEL